MRSVRFTPRGSEKRALGNIIDFGGFRWISVDFGGTFSMLGFRIPRAGGRWAGVDVDVDMRDMSMTELKIR